MSRRLELQTLLETLLGSRNVYYQPPDNLKMEYPCIRYSKNSIDSDKADNEKYLKKIQYTITIIDKRPDNQVIDKILELDYSNFVNHYCNDGLNHDVINLYF